MHRGLRNIILIGVLIVFSWSNAAAQTQFLRTDFSNLSATNGFDTQTKDKPVVEKEHSPKRAALLSLVPGLGQAYNKKYWKIPIIYAGIGTATYFMVKNNQEYQSFRSDFVNFQDTSFTGTLNNPEYNSVSQLREQKNYYWKRRDRMILIMAGVYILNILDATVDAHLYTFDISDDLSMRIEPDIQVRNLWYPQESYGLKLRFNF